MLAGPDRLRHGRDIDRVYRQGRYGRGELLSVRVLRRGTVSKRAVVIVGKKVSKSAVVRNRIRRRLGAILAAEWQQIAAGCDIVVTVHVDASMTKPEQLQQDLTKALIGAGALTKIN